MHWENLGTLAPLFPVALLLMLLGVGISFRSIYLDARQRKAERAGFERYWALEKAHQMKLRAMAWVRGSAVRRLTFQSAGDESAIAPGLADDYGTDEMADPDFSTRLSRARFRAWHRGTREADFTIGGFYDRHHAGWGETELTWFEALLEEEDVDILGWAMAMHAPPEKFAGPLMSELQKLDYVSI